MIKDLNNNNLKFSAYYIQHTQINKFQKYSKINLSSVYVSLQFCITEYFLLNIRQIKINTSVFSLNVNKLKYYFEIKSRINQQKTLIPNYGVKHATKLQDTWIKRNKNNINNNTTKLKCLHQIAHIFYIYNSTFETTEEETKQK